MEISLLRAINQAKKKKKSIINRICQARTLYLFLTMDEYVIKQRKAMNVTYSHLAENSVSSLKYHPCELFVTFFKMVLF